MTCEAWNLDMTYLAKRISFEFDIYNYVSWKSTWGRYANIEIINICSESITLKYTVQKSNGQIIPYCFKVSLDTTPCDYGGRRWWFFCPVCHRRCRVLYMPYSASVFACRICHNLAYESQQEGKSMWWSMFKAINHLDKWERQYYRTRSPRKREKLWRKIGPVYGGIQKIIQMRRRRKKRPRRKR